ncbi:ShlB/FhaC/HecB family hemolysin secretion/activation protein [Photorhabdus laumondii subsp. laumondii]|uniref:Photorhabdus luminescens subsp. laumondii TTO1 complete genome segment 11/17 n=2 Tax=Photorhabdus laumondii subsp. laumondii TaxID=141679 RepID=Q7N2L1_PHOLL|nr:MULTISPECIES: ShlB/FhaC/HecB family hemolysin secretion/activation protein [Photorhabdus]AWK42767.1 peptide transporter [Photorhabdus laumondii subsp. laumondii]AXG43542.1 ShlB/FhaC/HecB family hemolysin secretion/activation protein [Photorhabdus laumondii subsp. laumondii]AXG48085.1 ShlB/FhaC/HecB family hemolysin secretion/activation protein [Photorhabdus laumondii subsp. laumondii]MCC8382609.1 ShlB/FhaC/HecB family hemolysin secretion/activation protein [Photorhabdus laumondii]MCC8389517
MERISVCFRTLVVSVLFAISGQAYASAFIGPADQEVITQQQKALLQQAQQQREALRNNITLSPALEHETDGAKSVCHTIRYIQFEGVESLSQSVREKLIQSYLSRCLTLPDINELVRKVSNAYIERGYVTSRAGLRAQDLSTGTLIITVSEGKVESITLDGETSLSLKMAFPGMVGKTLNLRDIEQGMEQLNRLPSQQITIDIQPGKQPGYSAVILKRISTRLPVGASLGIDNSGQKSTGTGQINASVNVDNLLHLADQWSLSVSRNNDFRNNHRSRSLSSNVTIPYGDWLFNYQYAWNDSFQDIPIGLQSYRYEGDNQTHRLAINRTLYRDGEQKLALNAGITHRQTANLFAGKKLSISSPILSVANLGLNYSSVLAGGYITFNPALSYGLPVLGATKDDPYFPDAPRSQFRKFSLSVSYFIPISDSIYYLSSVYGQTTPYNLYASERLSLGGQYSVRGFKEQYLTGNRGGYWRNELNWQISELPVLGELALTGALDTGWLQGKTRQIDGGNVTGTALGISLTHSKFNQTMTLGTPLIYPDHLKPDNWVVYWSVSLIF